MIASDTRWLLRVKLVTESVASNAKNVDSTQKARSRPTLEKRADQGTRRRSGGPSAIYARLTHFQGHLALPSTR